MEPKLESGRLESATLAKCTYRSVAFLTALYENSKYADICDEICSRFKVLDIGSFELTYAIPDHPNCLLQSDMDVRMMLMCLEMLNIRIVDILVKDRVNSNIEGAGQNHVESAGSNNVPIHTTPMSRTVESHSATGENEHLGNSTSHEDNAYLSQGWREYISHAGQKFEGGVTEFRNKLRMYAIEMGFRFVYTRNDKFRVIAECFKKSEGCNWHIFGASCQANGYFYIRSLNNVHTCTSCTRGPKSKMMSSKIISSVIVDQIREKPTIKPADIVKDFKQQYGLDISYRIAWAGTKLAKSKVHGDESLSYHQLVWYRDALMSTNPGSHCVLESDPGTSRFQRLFVCYGACIEGFQWCRPLLFIDAIFLKSKYKGQLIGATGKDGNQGYFPFAFAIMDSESDENWSWFFDNLAKVLTPEGRTITFVSDRNKGLIEGISNIFPTSHHAFCLDGLKKNLFSIFPATYAKFFQERIVDLFMRCAYAPTEAAFEFNLKNLKDEGGAPIKTFLENLPKENWSYAYFKGNGYDEICNNVSESFTSWVSELWMLPICQMVDGIGIKLMDIIAERNREAGQWSSVLCPEMERTLNETLIMGKNWNVTCSSASVFEVHVEGTVTVDLSNHFCSCQDWQRKGFPCAHALVAVQKNSGCIYDYVGDFFKSSYFRSSYATLISPIPDIENATHEGSDDRVILPPLSRKCPGPMAKKLKSVEKLPRAIKCGRCGAVGRHNKKTCTANI
ncbi:uncharacterized protein LOC133734288 isoform X1 [Rosa rugosa]|uniref:uncharacterized protein LOC133734288 isoform X1 n=1 Tax=Rosa rugosa TaxID=74645 RepID=UPI002B414966|nr:uncharacterized protein LOC133734288 isoform X1 [Rosa rugosa]